MKLTILGNNGPYPSIGGATSGYLLQANNKNYVLDFGSGCLANLQRHVDLSEIEAIILTHLHFDHISDLGVLAYYMQVNKIGKIKLYIPEINDYVSMLLKTGFFTCVVYGSGEVNINGETIIATKMKHPVLSYALTFKEKDKTFSYTGDTTLCEEVEQVFKNSNVVLCDTAFLKEKWTEKLPHLNIYDACKIAQDNNVKIILTHITAKITKEELLKEAFGNYIVSKINESYKI